MRQKATYCRSIESGQQHERLKLTVPPTRGAGSLQHSDSWSHSGHQAAALKGGLAQTQTACQHKPKRRAGPAGHNASQ